jgi:hypothetical protein
MHSPTSRNSPRPALSGRTKVGALHGRVARRAAAAVAGVGVAVLFALTGCSSGSGTTRTAATTAAMRTLRQAVDQSSLVRSLTAALAVRSTQSKAGEITGTIAIRLRPTTLIAANLSLSAAGAPPTRLAEILTSTTIYVNNPAFVKATGKSWIKIGLSQASSRSGLAFASLFQNLVSANVLDQARLFAASSDVHKVGTATIGGVATTVYAGTYTAKAAMARLSPAQRRLLGPLLKQLGSKPARFQVWIDGAHLIRKAVETVTANGHTSTTTLLVKSINQPVTVTLPKPGQIAKLPGS